MPRTFFTPHRETSNACFITQPSTQSPYMGILSITADAEYKLWINPISLVNTPPDYTSTDLETLMQLYDTDLNNNERTEVPNIVVSSTSPMDVEQWRPVAHKMGYLHHRTSTGYRIYHLEKGIKWPERTTTSNTASTYSGYSNQYNTEGERKIANEDAEKIAQYFKTDRNFTRAVQKFTSLSLTPYDVIHILEQIRQHDRIPKYREKLSPETPTILADISNVIDPKYRTEINKDMMLCLYRNSTALPEDMIYSFMVEYLIKPTLEDLATLFTQYNFSKFQPAPWEDIIASIQGNTPTESDTNRNTARKLYATKVYSSS